MDNNVTNGAAWKFYHAKFSSNNYRHAIIIEVIALVGLVVCMAGYRFARFALFLAGFILTFSAFYIFSPSFIHTTYCCDARGKESVHLALSAVVGTFAGLLTSRLYKMGVILSGKCLGVMVALLILKAPTGKYFKGDATVGYFFATMAIVGGMLAARYEKPLLILATSFLGAYAAIGGVDLFVQSSFSFAVFDYLIYFKEALKVALHPKQQLRGLKMPHLTDAGIESSSELLMFGAWLILGLAGTVVQYRVTAKTFAEGGPVCPWDLCCLSPCRKASSYFCCFNHEQNSFNTENSTTKHKEPERVYYFVTPPSKEKNPLLPQYKK